MHGIEDYARENDLNILCFVGAPLKAYNLLKENRVKIFDFADKRNVDGLIMSRKVGRYLSATEIRRFFRRYQSLPVVNVGSKVKGIPSVYCPMANGVRQMVLHLVKTHGFTKIAFVRGRESIRYARERFAAFRQVMRSLKLPIHHVQPNINDFRYAGGQEAARILLDERSLRYEAIITENDLMALGVITALRSRGIEVPQDIAVVGTYELEAESCFEMPLTSVNIPLYAQGRIAAQLLNDRLAGRKTRQTVVTSSEIRIGTSCGCFFPEIMNLEPAVKRKKTTGLLSNAKKQAIMRQVNGIIREFSREKQVTLNKFVTLLLEAFEEELVRPEPDIFNKVLNTYFYIFRREGFHLSLMQKILSFFYEKTIPELADPGVVQKALTMLYKAHYILYKAIHYEESFLYLSESQKSVLYHLIEEELLTASSMDRIRELVYKKFPGLGVKSFLLALYKDAQDTRRLRRVMAYVDNEEIGLDPEEPYQPGAVLIRELCARIPRRSTILVSPLFYREESLGLAVFELEANDLNTLELLRNGLSCAILNTLNREVIEYRTMNLEAEVISRNEDLTVTNTKLKEEITERRKAEINLRRSEEQYKRWFKESFTANFVANGDGRITACNPAFVTIFEFPSAEEALKANFADFYPVASALDDFYTLLSLVKKIERYEAELVTMKGRRIGIIGHIIGTFNKKGELLEMRGYLIDNTAHKHLEDELRQSQKMEAIGRLSGGIAHDFNNLLTGIMGYSELLLEALDSSNPLRKDVEEIKKAGRIASSLTRQLLAFSRKQVLNPTVLDLNEVVMGMHEMLARLIGENIRLNLEPAERLHFVKADRGQIEQVIMNLVLNSRDALPGGGEIRIKTRNLNFEEAVHINNNMVRAGDYAMLEVIDNGAGMDQETQSHLFEPFFTTKTQGKGVGLGLSTVYGIVRQSAGYTEISSVPGEGTAVRIYLPRHGLELQAGGTEEVDFHRVELKGKVLVVEDDEHVRELARRILSHKGFEVLIAQDGEKAIEIFREKGDGIELVVSDVVMPGLDGPDLIRRLNRMKKGLKVVYISGYTAHHAMARSLSKKGVTFLQKPFTPETLLGAIYKVMEDGR